MTLSRRTILRGAGAALSLPMLEAMLPRTARGAAQGSRPVRMAFLYVPNGMNMDAWTPKQEGAEFELPRLLKPVEKHKKDMLVLSGLALNGARSLGDGGGDHARSVAAFLTGAHPKKTDGADIKNGPSVDQIAAEKIGNLTRFPSLELGLEGSSKGGRCDSGYSCVYTSNMSWRSPTTPMSKETNPREVFDRLFGNGDKNAVAGSRSKRDKYRKSVLDFVLEDATDLRKRLGVSDQRKVDEYLHAVREVERRVDGGDKLFAEEDGVSNFPRPKGAPAEFDEHAKLMLDLMALAFQTDATRVASFMFTNAGSNRSYREQGVRDGHHNLSHHGGNKDKIEGITKINEHHFRLLAHFLDRIATMKDGDDRLMDNCMIMYGSGIGDGNRHNHHDLPITLFGKGGGSIKTGRHIRYEEDTPLCNLYLSMLDRMGASTERMADSTGRLKGLDG
jgi:hypothetical protein